MIRPTCSTPRIRPPLPPSPCFASGQSFNSFATNSPWSPGSFLVDMTTLRSSWLVQVNSKYDHPAILRREWEAACFDQFRMLVTIFGSWKLRQFLKDREYRAYLISFIKTPEILRQYKVLFGELTEASTKLTGKVWFNSSQTIWRPHFRTPLPSDD